MLPPRAVQQDCDQSISDCLAGMQTGQVTGVHLVVDVREAAGTVRRGVPSTRLARPHPFAPGHFVVGGAWVGRIDAIEHHVTIAFDNGMVAKVSHPWIRF